MIWILWIYKWKRILLMMKNDVVQAEHLKAFLLKIYPCKKDFELLVIDKKPKTRMGVYIVDKQRIRIYSK